MLVKSEIRRLFGKDAGGGHGAWRETAKSATPFDFVTAESCKPKGHVVAVRVTSEDPDDGFKPTSGQVQVLIRFSRSDDIFLVQLVLPRARSNCP